MKNLVQGPLRLVTASIVAISVTAAMPAAAQFAVPEPAKPSVDTQTLAEIARLEAKFEEQRSTKSLDAGTIFELIDAYERGGEYQKAADLMEKMVEISEPQALNSVEALRAVLEMK